jgi:lipoyl(octanoyl) transferase
MYPLIDMNRRAIGVKRYVHLLEEAVIRTIAEYGIHGERVDGATGVWVGVGTPQERKICAIGIKCSRFITMHGLALNVCTDLNYFSAINPCGFVDKAVTSISAEVGHNVSFDEAAVSLRRHIANLLQLNSL